MNASDRFKDFESTLENKPQHHTKTNIFLALSRMFERSFFYGIRAVVVLYATDEILQMETYEAITIFGMLSTVVIVSQIIGGLLGDLWLGNKKTSFIGGIMQISGSLFLIIPHEIALYIGVGLIALGTGLYSSNFMAIFAKSYFHKLKLLDAGFTLVYGLVNLGSIIGVLFIGLVNERMGYNAGFAMTSLLMMISMLFLYLSKFDTKQVPTLSSVNLNSRVLTALFGVVFFIGFWVVYNITSIDVSSMDTQFFRLMDGKFFSNFSMRILNPIVVVVGAIGLFALWTFYRFKSSYKMIMGASFGLLGLVIIHFIWPNLTEDEILLFSLAIGILAIAELLITPILFSVVAKCTSPKYIATMMGFIAIVARISYVIAKQFMGETESEDASYLSTGIIILTFLLIIGFLFSYFTKNRTAS